MRFPAVVFGPPGLIYRLVLGLILFVAMIAAFVFASGAGSREKIVERAPAFDEDEDFDADEDSDHGSLTLGWIAQ